jgi:hypothetical protein
LLLALVIPWNNDLAEHVPTSLDAGGVMRVRRSNGWYSVEVRDGDGWRVECRTLRAAKMRELVDLYTG